MARSVAQSMCGEPVWRGAAPTVLPWCRPATPGQDSAALEIPPTGKVDATASGRSESGPRTAWCGGIPQGSRRREIPARLRIEASMATAPRGCGLAVEGGACSDERAGAFEAGQWLVVLVEQPHPAAVHLGPVTRRL